LSRGPALFQIECLDGERGLLLFRDGAIQIEGGANPGADENEYGDDDPDGQRAAARRFLGFEFPTDESTSLAGSFEPQVPEKTDFQPEDDREAQCDFCGRRCGVYSRNGFL